MIVSATMHYVLAVLAQLPGPNILQRHSMAVAEGNEYSVHQLLFDVLRCVNFRCSADSKMEASLDSDQLETAHEVSVDKSKPFQL